jgi:hypothetical protein
MTSRLPFVICFLVLLPSGSPAQEPSNKGQPDAAAAAEEPVYDKAIKATHVEKLSYPVLPWLARLGGIVVIRAKLDGAGKVVSASAVSGEELLIKDCLPNALQWKFQPNTNAEVIIVYDFRIEGECTTDPCPPASFVFRFPNIAIITRKAAPIEP